MCFFTYNIINGEDGTSSEPPFTAVTSEPPETEAPATDSDVSSAPESTASVEESSGTASDTSTDNQPTIDFDKEYFSSSLFIGDSISTGLSLYGFLDQDNVFAQQGLAPSTALDAEIDGVTLSDKIAAFKPKKIFVMLGTNSVGYADNETLAASMNELVEKISGLTKAKIYVISNSDGYFDADYAEMDGIHFMGTTYEVMLSYLQKHSS